MLSTKSGQISRKYSEKTLDGEMPPRVHKNSTCSDTMLAVSRAGVPVGEDHPRAKYLDYDIDCVFFLHEKGWTIREIGYKLDMPHSTVHAILTGKLRSAVPCRFKRKKE